MSADRKQRIRVSTAPAMGSSVRIATDANEEAVVAAHREIEELEARWSRFRADSEVSIANAASGPSIVSRPTAEVIAAALDGSRVTKGWYDPTLRAAIVAAGYDKPIDEGWASPVDTADRRGPASLVTVDVESGLVRISGSASIDLGAIGKGRAADLVTESLMSAGATFAVVEVGGDVRVRSTNRVVVEVAAPVGQRCGAALKIGLRDGGVATSGPTKRRAADGRHHLIDPSTGRPARSPRVATVVAKTAAGAEMLATAAAIAPLPEAVEILERVGATGWLIEADGTVTAVGSPQRFVVDEGWLRSPAQRAWAS